MHETFVTPSLSKGEKAKQKAGGPVSTYEHRSLPADAAKHSFFSNMVAD